MPTLDPRQFGARYDGGDDSAAIARCLAACPDGGTVHLSGVAGVGAQGVLLRSRKGVSLTQGYPSAGIRLLAVPVNAAGSLGAAGVLLDDCDGCTVAVNIQGNGIASAGIGSTRSRSCIIQKCWVEDLGGGAGAGIIAVGNTGNRYLANVVNQTMGQRRGMWIGNTAMGEMEQAPIITADHIYEAPATGLALVASGGKVTANFISGCKGSGIALAGGTSDMELSGNQCTENLYHGIQCDSTTVTKTITVQGNTLDANGVTGLYLIGANGWTVSGNKCRRNGANGNGIGIYLDRSSNVAIEGNECDDYDGVKSLQGIGIKVVAETVGQGIVEVALLNNVCRGNRDMGICATTVAGAWINGLRIIDNQADQNGEWDLFVVAAAGGPITNWKLMGNVAPKQRVPA